MNENAERMITEVANRCREIVNETGRIPVDIKGVPGEDNVWFVDFHERNVLAMCKQDEISEVLDQNPKWINSQEVISQALREYFYDE